jgi:tRNA dimethylallyltransferase
MNVDPQKKPLVVIAGPTASGKSALALALSRLTPVTIINADASQVYRDLRIISARPSLEEEAQAPHRLFGHIDGALACSAADWATTATDAIAEAHAAGRLPMLVGGTGLYLRTLLDGIAPVPGIDPVIRASIRALPVDDAYAALSEADPEAAACLSANDSTRIARALEVVKATGKTMTHWQAQPSGGIGTEVDVSAMILLPPRDWLYARCDARYDAMLTDGGVEEVQALLARGLDPVLPVMRAIGVREIADMLAARETPEDCAALAKIATRQFAKRQYTWFRNQSPPEWERIEASLDSSEFINELAIKLRDITLTS